MSDEPAAHRAATYAEIKLRFGLRDADHARIFAKRRKWQVAPRNHPRDLAVVQVPLADWRAAAERSPAVRVTLPAADAPPELGRDVAVNWLLALASLNQQLEQERGRADRAESRAERAEAEAAAAAARADRAVQAIAGLPAPLHVVVCRAVIAGVRRFR